MDPARRPTSNAASAPRAVRRLLSITALTLPAALLGCGASPPPETAIALVALPAPAVAAASVEPEEDAAPDPAQRRTKPSPRAAAAEAELEDTARTLARRLFIEGAEAYAQGDYLRARAKFQEAYDLVQSQPLLFNIASAEMRLGNIPAACRLFRKYITDGDPADPRIQEVQQQVSQRCSGVP